MNVYLDMIGCRLNQAEIEIYARQLRAAGHCIVENPEKAELVIINTCVVTAEAASDSRQKIRQAARLGNARVVLTGCWSTLFQEEARNMTGVTCVFANRDKDDLIPSLLNISNVHVTGDRRKPLPGSRQRTRAFIKTQDGCDNHCTYCITRLARGNGRSRSRDAVIDDIQYAIAGGVNEVVLTGVHLGSWGLDHQPSDTLACLISEILDETDIPRIRLSSLEPWDVSEPLIDLWRDPRLCHHFHLPLQSGSPSVLKRMARKTSPQEFAELVEKLRKNIPDVSITTDVIAGFPGETGMEFQETLDFIQQVGFSGGHVFVFSARPGTAAAEFPDQIPHPLRRERSLALRKIFKLASTSFQERFMGKTVEVLWEKSIRKGEWWNSTGLTGNYLKVRAVMPVESRNRFAKVKLLGVENGVMFGEVISHE